MNRIILSLSIICLVSACKTGPSNSNGEIDSAPQITEQTVPTTREIRRRTDPVPEPAPSQASNQADDPSTRLPSFTGELEVDGYGLDMILDGSSPEAFRQSLELIAMESSPAQFHEINQAIGYLRHSNLQFQDLNVLYKHLDGMTGREVLELVREQRRRRGR